MEYTHRLVLETIGRLVRARQQTAASLMRQLYNDMRENKVDVTMKLSYHDSEGLLVELSSSEASKFIHMDVARRHGDDMREEDDVRYIASCQFLTIDHAQAVARLLVGIEVQPDGAAWKRGPRPLARPTDARGNIVPVEDDDPPPTIRNCYHPATTYVAGHTWCDDCGAEVGKVGT